MAVKERRSIIKVSEKKKSFDLEKHGVLAQSKKKKELLEHMEDAKKSSVTFDNVEDLFVYLKS